MSEAVAALQQFMPPAHTQRSKYSLARITGLMKLLGNPQDKLKVIHVAGTSGKTSTCYFVASILSHAGLKVGLTVSPHIDKVSERLQINGEPVADKEFMNALNDFIEIVKASKLKLTYFEVLISMAYWYFAAQKVDVAVIETGLGGLLDASNVVSSKNKLCVITDIGLDHTEVLGRTIEAIAEQKAGIIQPGNSVFMYRQAQNVVDVFKNRCTEQKAELHFVDPASMAQFDDLSLFQKRNWALAFVVVRAWLVDNNKPALKPEQIEAAHKVVIPARMEIQKLGNKTLVLDGAHNAQKMQAFVDSFQAMFPGKKAAVLLAIKKGKDYKQVLDILLPVTSRLVLSSFKSYQDMPFASVEHNLLAKACKQRNFFNFVVTDNLKDAYKQLLKMESDILVVTGSLYLVSAVRQLDSK